MSSAGETAVVPIKLFKRSCGEGAEEVRTQQVCGESRR